MSDATDASFDHDVVVVGGGPSGCSAAVFTARDGFDTVVFDRGNAALRRAAFVENYLGFPAGIDIDSLYTRMHDHVRAAGADYLADMVVSVTRLGDPARSADEPVEGFTVETQDDRTVTARFVIAAAWYDGEYLRPLLGDDAFEVHDHGDGEHEHFDPDYADPDGRTPVDGLYVAAPNGEHNAQAIIAAGHGAQVARSLVEDVRRAEGYPAELAEPYDWLRRRAELEGEWLERDRWREWFHDRLPDDYDVSDDHDIGDDYDIGDDHLVDLRERYIDRAFTSIRSEDEIDELATRAHECLLDYVDDDLILERAHEIGSGPDTGSVEVDTR